LGVDSDKKALKISYGLDYDKSGINTSLIRWYNKLIDKTEEELDAADVRRMIRQDILSEVAIKKAIELFMSNPYGGEMWDGELLSILVTCDYDFEACTQQDSLSFVVTEAEKEMYDFVWCTDDDRELFKENLKILRGLLNGSEIQN